MSSLPTTFAALSDATRFEIVERLLREGPLSAGALAAGTDISAPAISRHLKVLRQAGVVERKIDGTRRIYSIRAEAIRAVSDWAIGHRDCWEASVFRLEKALMNRGLKDTRPKD